MPRIVHIAIIGIALWLISVTAPAQNARDALRYSLRYPSFDPISIVMPGVADATGIGAFQENPASMALFDQSFGSFGLSHRNVNEKTGFLGSRNSFGGNQVAVGDIGLVYIVPTVRGRLVVGGGYSQSTDFNRAFTVDTRNSRSTLTDFYNITADDALYNAAFNVYALDWADQDSTFTESIFRIGFPAGDFPGINQDVEVVETGNLGDFSGFLATEFRENLMLGASVGVTTGRYTYERQFLETDLFNDYNGNFIDSDNDGQGETDIDRILSVDTIDARMYGFSLRLGALYRPVQYLQLGVSYRFENKLNIEENYATSITSTFDNGDVFEDEVPGRITYKVVRPARLNTGVTLKRILGFTVSASAEYISYSDTRLDFGGESLEFQNSEKEFIEREFKDVWNLRAGISYRFNDQFIARAGYAHYPSPRKSFDATRRFYSAGFSTRISGAMWFDLGAQYTIWNDRNSLYTYDTGTELANEVVSEEVTRLHVMGGVRIGI